MEVEKNFRVGEIESRGALCVECMDDAPVGEAVLDRCGATLCRSCAGEFYVACAGCGGLTPRDEALERAEDEGLRCTECFARSGAAGDEETLPAEEEVAALVAEFVALHAEKKRLDDRLEEIKETLKRAARARPRISNAVVLRAGEEGGVRCSYSVKTAYDPEKLSVVEDLLGREGFEAIFERKVSFSPVKDRLEEFLSADDKEYDEARAAIAAAARQTEVTTLNVVTQKKKKA
jgi:hypothetical protein